jgi:pimeloyl-ACP methyl ester carboxylesterase
MITTRRIAANGLEFAVDCLGEGEDFALCLHGFPESRYSWRDQLPALAQLGYTVWAPDLRGYGQSSRPDGVAAYRASELLKDIAALIDVARAEGKTGKLVLIGHDWGGALGWFFVLNHIRPVDRFIVMNLPHPDIFARGLKTLRQLRKSWYVFWFQIPYWPERTLAAKNAAWIARAFRSSAINKERFSDAVLDVYRTNALAPGALTAMINWYRANFRNPFRTLPPAKTLDTPTLMIWGEHDTALGLELTEGTEQLVKNFTLRTIPNASHWVQQDTPDLVNRMMTAWLSDQTVPMA